MGNNSSSVVDSVKDKNVLKKQKNIELAQAKEMAREIVERHNASIAKELQEIPKFKYVDLHIKSVEFFVNFLPADDSEESLKSLLSLIVSPKGSKLNQTQCQAEVIKNKKHESVRKTWTNPLPAWSISYARSIFCRNYDVDPFTIEGLKFSTLKDIHEFSKKTHIPDHLEAVNSSKIRIGSNVLEINGYRFEASSAKAKGKSYLYLRVNFEKITEALKDKPKRKRKKKASAHGDTLEELKKENDVVALSGENRVPELDVSCKFGDSIEPKN